MAEDLARMDEMELDRLKIASAYSTSGDDHFNNFRYDSAINNFKKTWTIRESILGRSHVDSIHSIAQIANSYYFKSEHPTATIFYHAYYRNQRYVGWQNPPCDNSWFKDSLQKVVGYTKVQLQAYNQDIDLSVPFEKAGDGRRETGNYHASKEEYDKAIILEESSPPGIATPVGSYLYRKLACMSALSGTDVDWVKADRIGNKSWLADPNNGLWPAVCRKIMKGDEEYLLFISSAPLRHTKKRLYTVAILWRFNSERKMERRQEIPCD